MNSPQEQQQIRQQAAEWAVRLDGGDLDRARREALDGWLAADPRHPPALALAQQTWRQLGLLAEPVATAPALSVAKAPRCRWGRRKGWRRGAVAAVLLLALGGAWNERDGGVVWLADHATGKGEVRTLRLADGSVVELDAQSAIDVAYDSRERRVRLIEGGAIFRAAPRDAWEPRPFVVESAGGNIRALGTRFLVSRNADGSVQVGVLEHRVAVALEHPRTGTVGRRELGEGESLRYSAEGGVEAPLDGRLDDLTSWRRGLLVFDDQPLGEVVARLNRYRPGHLLVAPGALAQRRVSGVFRVADLEASLQSISDELGVHSLSLAGVTLLY
ncbi:FecR domain-containing protein [Pseudomonas paraeruginosa]|uniref:FecR family protein n=1 Tax=Pseudomonas paraeruginosa TaxID=2994495 RepID=UPI0037499517